MKLCQNVSLLLIKYFEFSTICILEGYSQNLRLIKPYFNPNQTDVWEALPGLGGLRKPPPPAILALEQIFAQKSCFPKGWHQFQLIWPLFGNFFQKSPKKSAKIENPSKNG